LLLIKLLILSGAGVGAAASLEVGTLLDGEFFDGEVYKCLYIYIYIFIYL
jgi:hypothetical protein